VVRHHAGGTANHMMWRQRARHLGRTRFRLLCQNVGGPQQDGGAVFGSGWALLAADPQGKLTLVSRRNQDSPLMNGKRFSPATTPDARLLSHYKKRRPNISLLPGGPPGSASATRLRKQER
jgi:hypothetical protein